VSHASGSDGRGVPHLQPGPLTPELPQALAGLTNPLAMERLLPNLARPEISGDILVLDLDGLKTQVPNRAVPMSAVRYRERSDGSWATIDRAVVGAATGELVYAVGLGQADGAQAEEARGMGYLAMVVAGATKDEQLIRVVPIGTNRLGEGVDLLQISNDQRVVSLRVSKSGDVRAAVRLPDGRVTTIGRAPTDSVPLVGELVGVDSLDTATWSLNFFDAMAPICLGFGCMEPGQALDGVAVAAIEDLSPELRATCSGTDAREGLAIAALPDVAAGVVVRDMAPQCRTLPATEGLSRCVRDGGELRMTATHTGQQGSDDVVAVSCRAADGAGESAVFAGAFGTEAGWQLIMRTDRAQLPGVTMEQQDDACQVLRVAANDSRTGAFMIDVPMSDCPETTTFQMRGLPEAMVAVGHDDAVALRNDGLVPARGLVFDVRAPGRASCELGGEGDTAPLCVDAWSNGTRLIRGATTFPGRSGRTWVVATLGAAAQLSQDSANDASEPQVRFTTKETVLVGLAASGAMITAPFPLAADCANWALVPDSELLVGACREGLRALRIDVADSDKAGAVGAVTLKGVGAWPVLNPTTGTGHVRFACGNGDHFETNTLACPALTVARDAAGTATVYAHLVTTSPRAEVVHALRFNPGQNPDGTALGFQTHLLSGLGSAAGPDATISEVWTESVDGRLYTILAVYDGPKALHNVGQTAIVTFGEGSDRDLKFGMTTRRTSPARSAHAVTPIGIATIGFKRDGSPHRALVGIMTDNSASMPDPETGEKRSGPADLDTIAVTSLDACDSLSTVPCRWTVSQTTSPFVAMTRGPGIGMPAEAILGHETRLVDANGDGLTDIVIAVAADDRVRLSARRPQVVRADGRGGFAEALSAPAELWSMPVGFARHDACNAPIVIGSEGLAMFAVDPWDLEICTAAQRDDVGDDS